MPSKRPLILLLLVTVFLSTAVAFRVQITHPMPGYRADTIEWATNGHIADTFTPLAYPLFAGLAYRIAGDHGILVLQVLLHVVLAGVCYLLLRELRLPVAWSAYGSLPVVLFPDLILSVSKLWDLTLSAVLLLLFVIVCLRIAHSTPSPSIALIATSGLLFAAAIFCRPNLILLLPIVLFLLLPRRTNLSAAGTAGRLTVFVVVAVVGFSLLGVESHGAVYFPSNGPYNLYAGHNPQTYAALLNHLNAEFSLAPDFYASHPGEPLPDFYSPEMGSTFTRRSIQFAIQHPGEELRLFVLKLLTFFRPDTKLHTLFSASGLIKSFLALPVILFLAALLLPGRPPLSFDDRLLLVFEICYILPFLLTNSDPRFRTPLDALLLLHLVSLLYRRRTSGFAPASISMPQTM
jgi:hypothetical protein